MWIMKRATPPMELSPGTPGRTPTGCLPHGDAGLGRPVGEAATRHGGISIRLTFRGDCQVDSPKSAGFARDTKTAGNAENTVDPVTPSYKQNRTKGGGSCTCCKPSRTSVS